ncbi:unnamed protein product [Musa textilis]
MALLSLIEVAQKYHHQEQEISFMEAASESPTYSECNPNCGWMKVGEFDVLKVDVSGMLSPSKILYVLLPKPVNAKDGRPTNEMKQYGGVLSEDD